MITSTSFYNPMVPWSSITIQQNNLYENIEIAQGIDPTQLY